MRPQSESELAEAVSSTRTGIRISGGGTRGALGNPVDVGISVETGGLSGISRYEPGALTVSAGAGTRLGEVEAALSEHGQQLPFEPMDHRGLLGTSGEPTIGAVAACNLSGPRRILAGACRDFLIGVRFVDGTGAVVKSGGRVMKNVTGYDLVKLLAGSYGTLGILTEVTFKVLPAPEARAVVLIEGLGDQDAVSAMTMALGSPYGVSGAAHATSGVDGKPVTMIRVEGFEESVRYRAARLVCHLSRFGEASVEDDIDRTAAGWAWVRDVEAFHGRDGDVWRVSVRPGDGPAAAAAARSGIDADVGVLYDWGGGLLWLLVPEGSDVRGCLKDFAGHASLVRASPETRRSLGAFHPLPGPLERISAKLRARFDPRSILNRGIMG